MDASRSTVQGCGTSPELESAGAHEVSTGAILDPVHNTMSQPAHLRALDTLDSDGAGVHNATILKEMLQVAEQPDLADTVLENSLRVSVQKKLG